MLEFHLMLDISSENEEVKLYGRNASWISWQFSGCYSDYLVGPIHWILGMRLYFNLGDHYNS